MPTSREQFLDMLVAGLGQVDRALLLVELEVFLDELRNQRVDRVVEIRLVFRRRRI